MSKYANLGGDSGVDLYAIGRGRIAVTFNDGSTYTYTNASTGRHAMGRMRTLAQQGEGLNEYINRSVARNRYESKS